MVSRTHALVVATVMVGCASDAEKPTPEEALLQDFVERMCAAVFSCECTDRFWFSQSECVDSMYRGVRDEHRRAIDNGLMFDAECVRTRTDAFDDLGCKTIYELMDSELPAYCFFSNGDQGEGEACQPDLLTTNDCAPGLRCALGQCQSYASLAEGDECRDVAFGSFCGSDLYCSSETGLCEPPPSPGEPCSTHEDCDPGHRAAGWCDDGACAPIKDFGDSCTEDAECFSGCFEGTCSMPDEDPIACYGTLF